MIQITAEEKGMRISLDLIEYVENEEPDYKRFLNDLVSVAASTIVVADKILYSNMCSSPAEKYDLIEEYISNVLITYNELMKDNKDIEGFPF